MSRRQGRTDLHDELSGKALRWFASRCTQRGSRGGFEVKLRDGYVADAVALGSFGGAEMRRYEHIWHRKTRTGHSSYVQDESGEWQKTWIHSSGDLDNYFACVFESKASKSDLLKTFGNYSSVRYTSAGHLHWVVVPELWGLEPDLPIWDFWGILQKSSTGLKEIRSPQYMDMEPERVSEFAHQLLWAKPRGTWRHKSSIPEEMQVPSL